MASTPEAYIKELPEDRRQVIAAIRKTIRENLPGGFEEMMNYGMIGYVVPHSLYPPGYHADKKQPLPFINLASQKNHIAFYHMGLSDSELLHWFLQAWKDYKPKKPDMGKTCIRFKPGEEIPLRLIADLVSKLTPQQWINRYESAIKK